MVHSLSVTNHNLKILHNVMNLHSPDTDKLPELRPTCEWPGKYVVGITVLLCPQEMPTASQNCFVFFFSLLHLEVSIQIYFMEPIRVQNL